MVQKFCGGNPNINAKACRPHRYVDLPSPKIKSVSYAQSKCAPPVYRPPLQNAQSYKYKQTTYKVLLWSPLPSIFPNQQLNKILTAAVLLHIFTKKLLQKF